MASEFAPPRYRGKALYFVESALCGEQSRKIGNSI
jgi:hypothetical protein